MTSSSDVANFYARRSVFITGGTGFVGKQTIEKLLRSCPAIERVYLLMRSKKNKSAQQRLEEMLKLPLFEILRRQQPNFMQKIVVVQGELTCPGFGISDADHNIVSANVSVFIHIAASISFRLPLRDAVEYNIIGTRYAIQLARSLKNPEAFIYVSTAYSNVDKEVVEEKVYDPPMDPEILINLVHTLSPEQLELITPSLLGRFPNTYTFTKGVAEKLVENEIGGIPCAIVRPSIISPSFKEPFEGWVYGMTAFTGIISGGGLGMIISAKCTSKRDTKMDFVPVDLTANAIIVAGWDLVANKSKKDDPSKVTVYNLITGDISPITVYESGKIIELYANKYPLSNRIRKPKCLPSWNDGSWYYRQFDQYIELPLRCYLADIVLRLTGKEPRARKIMELCNMIREVTGYFMSNEWEWRTENLVQLEKSLSPDDRKEFDLNRSIPWDKHHLISWLGVKKFIHKETNGLTAHNEEPIKSDDRSDVLQSSSEQKQ